MFSVCFLECNILFLYFAYSLFLFHFDSIKKSPTNYSQALSNLRYYFYAGIVPLQDCDTSS